MYYRWTESAKNLDAFKKNFAEIGKWYRARWNQIREEIPEYYHLVRQGYIEEKPESSTRKQVNQRKMWQFVGRIKALDKQEKVLIADLRRTYPRRFRTMSDADVVAMFYQDAVTNDLGLMVKIYNGN